MIQGFRIGRKYLYTGTAEHRPEDDWVTEMDFVLAGQPVECVAGSGDTADLGSGDEWTWPLDEFVEAIETAEEAPLPLPFMKIEFQVLRDDPAATMFAGLMALTRADFYPELSSKERLVILELAAKVYEASFKSCEPSCSN